MGKRVMGNKKGKKLKIVAVRPENLQRTFSNYAEVTSNPSEVSIRFCDVKPPVKEDISEALKTGKVKATVISEIVLPFLVGDALLDALKSQIEKIKKEKK